LKLFGRRLDGARLAGAAAEPPKLEVGSWKLEVGIKEDRSFPFNFHLLTFNLFSRRGARMASVKRLQRSVKALKHREARIISHLRDIDKSIRRAKESEDFHEAGLLIEEIRSHYGRLTATKRRISRLEWTIKKQIDVRRQRARRSLGRRQESSPRLFPHLSRRSGARMAKPPAAQKAGKWKTGNGEWQNKVSKAILPFSIYHFPFTFFRLAAHSGARMAAGSGASLFFSEGGYRSQTLNHPLLIFGRWVWTQTRA